MNHKELLERAHKTLFSACANIDVPPKEWPGYAIRELFEVAHDLRMALIDTIAELDDVSGLAVDLTKNKVKMEVDKCGPTHFACECQLKLIRDLKQERDQHILELKSIRDKNTRRRP